MVKIKKIKRNVVSLKKDIKQDKLLPENLLLDKFENEQIDKATVVSDKEIREHFSNEIDKLEFLIDQESNTEKRKQLEKQLKYTKELLRRELSKDLVISQIDSILNQLIKANEKEQIELKEKIRILLKIYNEKNLKNAFDILNIESLDDIYSQDKSLKSTRDFRAFVYYFWNAEHMNFRIIGLREIYPLFEIIETQEMFFLDKATMTTLGKPVFWIIKGIPLTQQITLTKESKEMSDKFTMLGYNSAQIKAMTRSPIFIRIFGLHGLQLKTKILIILLNVINSLLCYIIFSTLWLT